MQIGHSSHSCVGISLRAGWGLRVMPAVFERVLGRGVYGASSASNVWYLLLAEESLVLLLSLDECLLEAVRVCTLLACGSFLLYDVQTYCRCWQNG